MSAMKAAPWNSRSQTRDLTRILPGDVIRVRTSLFWQAMNVFTPIAGPAALAAAAFH